jgi:DNA-binding NarL/FixJ family response regulator
MSGVVAYLDDIFFQAKILETAKQLGIELNICATPEAFATRIASAKPDRLIVDLNARVNPFDVIARAKSDVPDVPIVGFLSHVETELAERARAAGCDEVMPRSKFTRDLATILAGAKSHS